MIYFLFLSIIFSFILSIQALSELKNVQITGCVLIEDPYVIKDPTDPLNYSGIAITYLNLLRNNLAFDLQLKPWNDKWSKFIDTMANCSTLPNSNNECPCDIGIGSFTMTNQRAEIIQFVWPFSNEAHHMISRKSDLRVDDSEDHWFVFKTFSFSVWILIAFGIILHAVGTIFFGPFKPQQKHIEKNLPRATSRNLGKKRETHAKARWQLSRFPAAIVYAYSHLLGHPVGTELHTPSIHRSAWNVLGITAGLFLLTVYESSLTVLLFESTKSSPFRRLSDFTQCGLNPSRVAMISGGASHEFWNNAVNNSYIQQNCGWGAVGIPVSNITEGFKKVRNGQADYFFSLEGSVTITANRNCSDLTPVGEPFFSTSVGFVLPKQYPKYLYNNLSRVTRILREQDKYKSATALAAESSCDSDVDARITAPKLASFFTLYVITWTFLLVYRMIFIWRRRRSIKKTKIDDSDNFDLEAMDLAVPPPIVTDNARYFYPAYQNFYTPYPIGYPYAT